MHDSILQEQIRYYRERAGEYDATVLGDKGEPATPQGTEFADLAQVIAGLTPCGHALEIACGTGIWTQPLLRVSQRILAVDAAPEMIARNQAKVADPRVDYLVADLFAWEPDRAYDLALCAFWLSHVPPDILTAFVMKLRRMVRPGGQLCVMDEPASSLARRDPNDSATREERSLQDGRKFDIVKVYYAPATLAELCERAGFAQVAIRQGDYFYSLVAQ
jgi:demethylmenaquinone methyltransferase/2-methoxy-6-polyprenyl-1,4-benzoquinol methylase